MNNIPEGYKLVPVELTDEMLIAYADASIAPVGRISSHGYEAMLAAAPAPPQPVYSALNFVCTALPGPGNECAFVELENDAGESLGHGEWRNRDDGLVELHIAAPQPIFDEAKERSTCRKEWKLRNRHSHFEPVSFPDYWAGWKDRAQSRAKAGEDE